MLAILYTQHLFQVCPSQWLFLRFFYNKWMETTICSAGQTPTATELMCRVGQTAADKERESQQSPEHHQPQAVNQGPGDMQSGLLIGCFLLLGFSPQGFAQKGHSSVFLVHHVSCISSAKRQTLRQLYGLQLSLNYTSDSTSSRDF